MLLQVETAVEQIRGYGGVMREFYDTSEDKRLTQFALLDGVATLVTSSIKGALSPMGLMTPAPGATESVLNKTPAILTALYAVV